MIVMLLLVGSATAAIQGIAGPVFNLTATVGRVTIDDGTVITMWGFANANVVGSVATYPGPTLIVTQGQVVTVTLTNQLPRPVSIVFPGQQNVTSTGGVPGLLTQEAAPGATITYTFTAVNPGTFIYYSGSEPELQFEMGLFGALIVRPTMGPKFAYNDASTAFDREYLFLVSDIDPLIHKAIALSIKPVDHTSAWPVCWFINGRAGLDTIVPNNDPIMPNQPLAALALMQPGEKVLLRMIGGGRDAHPFHVHGNHHRVIGRDGRLLKTLLGQDLSEGAFTTTLASGQTHDALFTWDGAGVGWDIYGHAPGDALQPGEDPTYHGTPFPVVLPDIKDMLPGPLYPGSPFLGGAGQLPPGEGGFNPWGAFPFMWHSHNEKELTSNDIFPGGMLTWVLIVPPGTLAAE